MAVTDLKLEKLATARYAPRVKKEGIGHAFRQIGVFSGDGLPSHSHLSAVRPALPRPSQSAALQLSRSIPQYGFCATDLSRESTGHRGLSPCSTKQAVLHRYKKQHFPKYPGQCQQSARLAYLCRVRWNPRARPLYSRTKVRFPSPIMPPSSCCKSPNRLLKACCPRKIDEAVRYCKNQSRTDLPRSSTDIALGR